MKALLSACCAASVLCATAIAQSDIEIASQRDIKTLGEVLVTGEFPGPGLWKVSKVTDDGDHVLWIFGMPSWLPKGVVWKSKQAEDILKETQEIIYDGGVSAHAGIFKGLRMLPRFLRVRKNPKGKTLADIVPAELHERIEKLTTRYGIDASMVENLAPIFAQQALSQRVVAAASLTSFWSSPGWLTAYKDAMRRKVKVMSTGVNAGDPVELLKNLERGPSGAAIECLALTVTYLETVVGSANTRAHSWAIGDIEGMRRFDDPDPQPACDAAIFGELRAPVLRAQAIDNWIVGAEKALANNQTTFAILPINELLNAEGKLNVLRQKGYEIEEPN